MDWFLYAIGLRREKVKLVLNSLNLCHEYIKFIAKYKGNNKL